MKSVRKAGAVLLAVAIVLSLSITAFAASNTKKITVEQSKDSYMQISGYDSEGTFNNSTVVYSTSPVTVQFFGSDTQMEYVYLMPDAVCDSAGNITAGGDRYAEMQFTKNYDDNTYCYVSGNSVTLEYSGVYCAIAAPEAAVGTSCFIVVNTTSDTSREIASQSLPYITLDGTSVIMNGKLINGNNYFKLRELAVIMNGSGKQFDVAWDDSVKAINILSNTAYSTMSDSDHSYFIGQDPDVVVHASHPTIYVDGQKVEVTAYNVFGNYYFKLRDIAAVLDFGVTWNSGTSTIEIDTTTRYSE